MTCRAGKVLGMPSGRPSLTHFRRRQLPRVLRRLCSTSTAEARHSRTSGLELPDELSHFRVDSGTLMQFPDRAVDDVSALLRRQHPVSLCGIE